MDKKRAFLCPWGVKTFFFTTPLLEPLIISFFLSFPYRKNLQWSYLCFFFDVWGSVGACVYDEIVFFFLLLWYFFRPQYNSFFSPARNFSGETILFHFIYIAKPISNHTLFPIKHAPGVETFSRFVGLPAKKFKGTKSKLHVKKIQKNFFSYLCRPDYFDVDWYLYFVKFFINFRLLKEKKMMKGNLLW